MPSVSIRLRNSNAADNIQIADIALRMSALLVTLARSSTSHSGRQSHETGIPTEIQHEIYLTEKLKKLFLSINDSGEWLVNSQPSESQLDKPSWWLREFAESFLHSSLAHQSECMQLAANPTNSESELEFDGIQALRNACLFAIERSTWSDRFALATQIESRRQVYNLAYGLSHEINNPLANIAARAEQLMSRVSNATDRKSLATIVDQAMRAHEMLAEMMLAVQPPTMNFIVHDLQDLVRKAIASFAARAESARVGLESQITECKLKYPCDATGLSEAIAAAIRNALEAARPGDLVQVILEIAPQSEQPTPREIRIAVVDNGPGMSPNALQRVWDLYYSGREAGRGLGLGLAKLRRNIEAHHGRVWINSVPGGGTSVEIRLPFTS